MGRSAFSIHGCFGDHMVLQRGQFVRLTGTAMPDAVVTGSFRGHLATATVPESGEWALEFPAGPEGGPFELSVTCGQFATTTLRDIMVGEVWFCSGQSNMEFPVMCDADFWGLPDGEAVRHDGDAGIRLFQTPRIVSPDGPCDEPPGRLRWERGDDPDAVGAFSAVAWFFGKALRRRLGPGVPVGLVHSSWGGTMIEPWIPRFAYERAGRAAELAMIEHAVTFRAGTDDNERDKARLRELEPVREWLRDKFFGPHAAASAAALASWASPSLPAGEAALWKRGPRGCGDGLFRVGVTWFRREFTAPQSWNGRHIDIRAAYINDCDETFLDGVKVGETTIDTPSYWAAPRCYSATMPASGDGRHVLAFRVQNHFATGVLPAPITISCPATGETIELAGGEWMERVEFHVDVDESGTRPTVSSDGADPRQSHQVPSTLFNSMVAPFLPLALRGVIWYQGCSNSGNPRDYAPLQDMHVASWREAFRNPGLVFLATELSAYRQHTPGARLPDDWWHALTPAESVGPTSFAPIRAIQERLLDAPGCGTACTIDIGDHSDIHPARKQPVGERLAHEAMRVAYGDATAIPGPRANCAALDGAAVRVTIGDAIGGLVSAAGVTIPAASHLFALAGDEGAWVWADAAIQPDGTITVSSPAVRRPVRVEYAWSDYPPEEDLLHRVSDGLPLYPFRLKVN